MDINKEIIPLLQTLISLPSFSENEEKTAKCLMDFMSSRKIKAQRKYNNIWVSCKYFDKNKATILLNSHHDTVKPVDGYTLDPYDPIIEDGRLFGLGSNDAGGALVSLLAAFLHFYDRSDIPWNLVFAATAEEEISGKKGVGSILTEIGSVDLAIVGEPTSMNMAVAEKGLLVLDCEYKGRAGHAGRGEGDNAIYKALNDIEWFRDFKFSKISDLLGPITMSVTQISAGKNHNVTPDHCNMVVDVRCTELYTLGEIIEIIEKHTSGKVSPRSVRLKASSIDLNHPVVKAARELNIKTFGSPALSDQALMPFNSIKIGPGDSSRSHIANEFIYLDQIENGIQYYIRLLSAIDDLKNVNKLKNETVG